MKKTPKTQCEITKRINKMAKKEQKQVERALKALDVVAKGLWDPKREAKRWELLDTDIFAKHKEDLLQSAINALRSELNSRLQSWQLYFLLQEKRDKK